MVSSGGFVSSGGGGDWKRTVELMIILTSRQRNVYCKTLFPFAGLLNNILRCDIELIMCGETARWLEWNGGDGIVILEQSTNRPRCLFFGE